MNARRTRSGLSAAIVDNLANDPPTPSPPTFRGWARMQAPPPTPPTLIDRRLHERLSPFERDRYDTSRLHAHGRITALNTPQMEQAHAALGKAITAVVTDHSPVAHQGLFLTGPPHVGKSTIALSFAQMLEQDLREARGLPIEDPDRPPRDDEGALFVPIAYTLAASSVGGTLTNLLAFYGERAENRRVPEMIMRVAFLMEAAGTRVLIIDQAQELAGTRAKIASQSEMLKQLLDTNLGLTILGAGIDLEQLPLFRSSQSPQLRQSVFRFPLHEVKPFPADRPQDLAPLLDAIERRLLLFNHPAGSLAKQADLILHMTRGCTGLIVRLVRDAAMLAITGGEERITQKTLRKAQQIPPRALKAIT